MSLLDIFDKFRDTVILKESSELEERVKLLQELKKKYPNNKTVNQQLYMAQRGLAGEKEIMYHLKKANIGMFVLHDINIEYEDLKAQIDFIVVTQWCCYFIECKNFSENIIVNEKGDFIREHSYKGHKVKNGIDSPYRQVEAQLDVYMKIWAKLQGKFKSFIYEKNFAKLHRGLVVIANGENILNTRYAPREIQNNVIKVDSLIRKLKYDKEHSDKDLWDNRTETEKWANSFLKLNVKNEENFYLELEKWNEIIKEEEINEMKKSSDIQINELESDAQFIEAKATDYKEILKSKLIEFRKKRSNERKIPAFYVFNNEELDKIIEKLPQTLEELHPLLPYVKIKNHGREIINIIGESKLNC